MSWLWSTPGQPFRDFKRVQDPPEDPTDRYALSLARSQRTRDYCVAVEEVKMLQEELTMCYLRAGVNQQEDCKALADAYVNKVQARNYGAYDPSGTKNMMKVGRRRRAGAGTARAGKHALVGRLRRGASAPCAHPAHACCAPNPCSRPARRTTKCGANRPARTDRRHPCRDGMGRADSGCSWRHLARAPLLAVPIRRDRIGRAPWTLTWDGRPAPRSGRAQCPIRNGARPGAWAHLAARDIDATARC